MLSLNVPWRNHKYFNMFVQNMGVEQGTSRVQIILIILFSFFINYNINNNTGTKLYEESSLDDAGISLFLRKHISNLIHLSFGLFILKSSIFAVVVRQLPRHPCTAVSLNILLPANVKRLYVVEFDYFCRNWLFCLCLGTYLFSLYSRTEIQNICLCSVNGIWFSVRLVILH